MSIQSCPRCGHPIYVPDIPAPREPAQAEPVIPVVAEFTKGQIEMRDRMLAKLMELDLIGKDDYTKLMAIEIKSSR